MIFVLQDQRPMSFCVAGHERSFWLAGEVIFVVARPSLFLLSLSDGHYVLGGHAAPSFFSSGYD
jgi:hypothetical protein